MASALTVLPIPSRKVTRKIQIAFYKWLGTREWPYSTLLLLSSWRVAFAEMILSSSTISLTSSFFHRNENIRYLFNVHSADKRMEWLAEFENVKLRLTHNNNPGWYLQEDNIYDGEAAVLRRTLPLLSNLMPMFIIENKHKVLCFSVYVFQFSIIIVLFAYNPCELTICIVKVFSLIHYYHCITFLLLGLRNFINGCYLFFSQTKYFPFVYFSDSLSPNGIAWDDPCLISRSF